MSSTARSTRKPSATPLDLLLLSVKVDRSTYGDPVALGNLLSGASGAVAACDSIDSGAYADQKTLASGTGVSESTVTRLVNAGRIMIDNAETVLGREAAVYTAVTLLGVKKATTAVKEGGIDGLLSATEKEKTRRAEASKGARKAASEKGDDTAGVETVEIKTLGDMVRALEPVALKAALLAEGASLNPVEAAALVSVLDNLTHAARVAGVDIDAVRAEMAA